MVLHVEKRQYSFSLKHITMNDRRTLRVDTVEKAGYPADQRDALREELTEMSRSCAGM